MDNVQYNELLKKIHKLKNEGADKDTILSIIKTQDLSITDVMKIYQDMFDSSKNTSINNLEANVVENNNKADVSHKLKNYYKEVSSAFSEELTPERLNNILKAKEHQTTEQKIVNALVYTFCTLLVIVVGYLSLTHFVKVFQNAEDPITHYQKMFGYNEVTPEVLKEQNDCTKNYLKSHDNDKIINANDLSTAQSSCSVTNTETKAKQQEALK